MDHQIKGPVLKRKKVVIRKKGRVREKAEPLVRETCHHRDVGKRPVNVFQPFCKLRSRLLMQKQRSALTDRTASTR